MPKSKEKKKGIVSHLNEVSAVLPMIQLANKSAKKVHSSAIKIKKDVPGNVHQRFEEACDYKSDADVNEKTKGELLEVMKLSVNKAPLSGDNHSNGDDFSKLQSLSCGKRRYSNSFHADVTAPKKLRLNEIRRRGIELTSNLPCQNDIDKRWTNVKTSEDKESVIGICNDVCCFIKDKYHGDILHVRPSYDSANKNHIQFVVTTKEDSDNSQFDFKYSTVVRQANTYSKEAYVVMKSMDSRSHMLSYEDSDRIKNVITSRAEELLKTHRYLSVISGSGIRSRGFSQRKHELIQEVCIVLYVQTKGKIPLDETEFPKFLDGIPVDVIEGGFQTCAKASERQPNLCMGCQIESENGVGTLGGFVEHPSYGLSAITCAHVVLNDADINKIQSNGGRYVWNSSTKSVYQPNNDDVFSNRFGYVKEAIFKHGGNGEPGVDVAVVQIESRPPLTGSFPDAESNQREKVEFETGQSRSSLNENNNYVVKYGCITNETGGYVQFNNTVVKRTGHHHNNRLPVDDSTYIFFNQIEIRPSSGSFADKGDSGSLVFHKNVSGEYVCIGMVVGRILPSGNGVVLPISAILSELGINGFKDFRLNKLNAIEKRLSNIEKSLINIEQKLTTK